MSDNPRFWIEALRTAMYCTDCNEKRRVIENAANALERVIAERDADRSALSEGALKVALIASTAQSDLTAARAECEALRLDAERYRWLRDRHNEPSPGWHVRSNYTDIPDDLDAAIDQALEPK